MLTDRQQAILNFINKYEDDNAFPPSVREIGRQFGGKDHTTIIHACKQVIKAKDNDSALSATLDSLKEQILRA